MSIIVPLEQKLEKLINFSKLLSKKFSENLDRGLSSYIQTHTHTHTNKHSEAKRHTATPFRYKYAKKIIGSFLEMLPDIIFSGGATEVYAKPP